MGSLTTHYKNLLALLATPVNFILTNIMSTNTSSTICHASFEAVILIDSIESEPGVGANNRRIKFKVILDANPEPEDFSLRVWTSNPPAVGEAVRIKAIIAHSGRAGVMPQLDNMRMEQFPWADPNGECSLTAKELTR
jgi:hypothetical protein